MWIWASILIGIIIILGVVIGVAIGKRIYNYPDYYSNQSAEAFGKKGEMTVSYALRSIKTSYGGYIFDNYCFEDDDGFSSEIDHIFITRGGVFIIETKSYKGRLIGKEEDKKWMQVKEDYQEDKIIKNPIMQNQGHINHLKKMLGKDAPEMISMVIFPYADISGIKSDKLFSLGNAISFIRTETIKKRYSENEVERLFQLFKDILDAYRISSEAHIRNIEEIN